MTEGISVSQGSERTQDVVERLREEIIADSFEAGQIRSGALAERLIRERGDAADAIASLLEQVERERERADKFMWQVRDTCARAEAAQSRVSVLEGALRPFKEIAEVALSEAPADADYLSVFIDSEGKSHRVTLDHLRGVIAALDHSLPVNAGSTSSDGVCELCGGDCAAANPPVTNCPQKDGDPLADLVTRFSAALLAKLQAARAKYGYDENWRNPGWQDHCQKALIEHLAKGDPRDVAAYCAFMWHHGWSTLSPDTARADREATSLSPMLETIKRLMADLGQPNSRSLYQAFMQFANEHVPTPGKPWVCLARKQNTAHHDPAECDWPVCGCDPFAEKVIAALEERGSLVATSPSSDAAVVHKSLSAGEPVAWRYRFVTTTDGKEWSDWFIVEYPNSIPFRPQQVVEPLFAAPQPVAWDASHNRSHPQVEKRAREIYDKLLGAADYPWIDGGNSIIQDKCRDQARSELRAATPSFENSDGGK